MAVGVNTRTAFSLLFPPILAEFGWDRGRTAASFSIGFIAAVAYAPAIGVVMDRFGPRLVIPFGAVLVSVGMILATFVTQPWHLDLSMGVLVGGGTIFLSYMGHSLFLPYWFARRRGLALGIAFSGVGVGSIILFPWLQALISRVGWRQVCWVMAGLLLMTVLPPNLLLQRRRPEDLGLKPDGESPSALPLQTRVQVDNVVDHEWASIDWTLALAMKTTRFWWLFLASASCLYAWYAVQVHQTKYLGEIGFPPGAAAYALGLVGLAGSVGQIALGHLSDRIGREWVWTVSALGFALCYALLLVMRQHPIPVLLYLMVAAQGLLGYGFASVSSAIMMELFQGKQYSTIVGVLSVSGSLGAGLGPWMTGTLYDRTGSYALAFWLAIALSLFSIVCVWRAAPRKVRVVAGQVARLHARRHSQGQEQTA
ncbi:MAG TPA: MFS transporter [Candidatus Binatia bacterium]|nr:MFS transporter [Candidatus Binatia bacterium]